MRRLSCAVFVWALASLAVPPPAGASVNSQWRLALAQVQLAARDALQLRGEGEDDTEARAAVRRRLSESLKAALDPEWDEPSLPSRLASILTLADRFPPERHPHVHAAFSTAVHRAVENVPPTQFDELEELLGRLWEARNASTARRTVVARSLLAYALPALMQKTLRKAELAGLLVEPVEREVGWLPVLAPRPLPLSSAIRVLRAQPESPTLYPLLEALELGYQEILLADDPQRVLTPVTTQLVEVLRKSQVQVKGPGGEPLPLEDDRAPSQTRLWLRAIDLLGAWTAQSDYVWHEEWDHFWKLYEGEIQGPKAFDFREARARLLGEGTGKTTVRVRGKRPDRFFGIEARTSKFLLIVDVSGSMIENSRNVDRLAGLKREAIRFLRELRPGSYFNILPFSSKSSIGRSLSGGHELIAKRRPRGSLDPKVEKWIRALKADGSTRADLAFDAAFGAERGDVPGGFEPRFKEIYFITDGSPTHAGGGALRGEAIDGLLARIEALNARHRVIIHAIAFPGMGTYFLQKLARRSGGVLRIIRDLEKGE